MTERPRRIWAWPHTKYDGDGSYIENYVEGKHPEDAVEYIRADSVPDVDVEDIAHRVRDAVFKTYGVNIDPVWLERILREALEVHDD